MIPHVHTPRKIWAPMWTQYSQSLELLTTPSADNFTLKIIPHLRIEKTNSQNPLHTLHSLTKRFDLAWDHLIGRYRSADPRWNQISFQKYYYQG